MHSNAQFPFRNIAAVMLCAVYLQICINVLQLFFLFAFSVKPFSFFLFTVLLFQFVVPLVFADVLLKFVKTPPETNPQTLRLLTPAPCQPRVNKYQPFKDFMCRQHTLYSTRLNKNNIPSCGSFCTALTIPRYK